MRKHRPVAVISPSRPSVLFRLLMQAPVAVTVTIGSGLLLLPEPTGRLLALPAGRRAVRAIGLADLLLATAMLTSRPRWLAMLARAVLNLLLGALYLGRAGTSDDPGRARRMGYVMGTLVAVDSATAATMRRRGW